MKIIDEQSLDALDVVRDALASGRTTLSEYESKKLIAGFQVPVAREQTAQGLESVLSRAEELGYPVVLKACSDQLQHKTERGLLEVNIRNAEELEIAYQRILNNLAGDEASFWFRRW